MAREILADTKLCVSRSHNRPFSARLAAIFRSGVTVSCRDLFDKDNCERRKLPDDAKPDYDIIQFSFVVLNCQGRPLFIQRKKSHTITRGNSILQSCSPWSHPRNQRAPRAIEDMRFYAEQEIQFRAPKYELGFLGVGHRLRKGINYYFFVFVVRHRHLAPVVCLKTDFDKLLGHRTARSRHLLESGSMDDLVFQALMARTSATPASHYRGPDAWFLLDVSGDFERAFFARSASRDVFISHSTEDDKLINRLVRDLTGRGIHCWVDHYDGEAGTVFARALSKTIRSTLVTIVACSPHIKNSAWVGQEIEQALAVRGSSNRIVPVLLHGTPEADIPMRLKDRLWRDLSQNWKGGVELLVQDIQAKLARQRRKRH